MVRWSFSPIVRPNWSSTKQIERRPPFSILDEIPDKTLSIFSLGICSKTSKQRIHCAGSRSEERSQRQLSVKQIEELIERRSKVSGSRASFVMSTRWTLKPALSKGKDNLSVRHAKSRTVSSCWIWSEKEEMNSNLNK